MSSAGLCQPPGISLSGELRTFTELGLSDSDIRSVAAFMRAWDPEVFERALRYLSDERQAGRKAGL
jgi:hypothetical protein